ncbi:uncharacterized protein FIBRA_02741 [Fibroporia radiculosa]|uniref:Nucleotide exchange factor Fes1 domain-containing protein n=1 Tax=Fibroporia radiculosa TaxID=599839 RepID=J4I981_9APHY|nr:uncharacterized protein FIBRA_02741 [Fibroporia radiculosa]CCM00701.1 predicted protein [Fibroporia radiculosa]
MENLLRWGIEHSAGQQSTSTPPRRDLDPGVIDAILGKSDSQMMKEALTVAVDETRNEDDRIQALDDFEMLVEQIDNANNVDKMKMWEPLHGLLTSSSSTDEIKMQVLWIIGTAVQNNPSAQASYLSLNPASTLAACLDSSVRSDKLRSKAVYALSGLLKHNAPAVRQFQDAGGWEALKAALGDSDITVRRKVAFLLNTLLLPTTLVPQHQRNDLGSDAIPSPAESSEPIHPNSHASMQADPSSFSTSPATFQALTAHGLLPALISSLTSPTPFGADGDREEDADFEEKLVRLLHTYVTLCHGRFSTQQKNELSAYVKAQTARAGNESDLADRWGLAADELQSLKDAIAY